MQADVVDPLNAWRCAQRPRNLCAEVELRGPRHAVLYGPLKHGRNAPANLVVDLGREPQRATWQGAMAGRQSAR